MLKCWCVIILMLAFGGPDAAAQRRRQSTAKQKTANTKKAEKEPAKITVDTAHAAVTIDTPRVVIADTAAKASSDTSTIEKVADVVHDSIKAQLKAPIVQVPIRLKTLIVPAALFGYGIVTLNNTGLRVINEQARDWISPGGNFDRPYVEDYLLLAPAVAVYGLNIAGVKGQNNLVDRSVIFGMSNLISNGFTFGLKSFGIQRRPDSSDNHSFASGHTAQAFVSAEFFHQEYKGRVHWTVTAAAYAVATSVAYLRVYHNKHWLSDVVAGAGIGMASTRFSYYLYPIIKNWLFGSKKVKEGAVFLPMYRQGGGYGLGLVYQF